MRLYAYCVSDEVSARVLEATRGVGGTHARLMEFGEISVVVSDVGEDAVAATRENVFAHERVIREVLQRTTPLPFRFGTVVSKERLESYTNAHRAELLKGLERVRDAVEMGVKIIWDAEEARRELEAEGAQAPASSLDEAVGTGAAYLHAKRRELMGDELLKERAEEIARWLGEQVGPCASESKIRVRPLEALVLRADYLVPRGLLAEYRERVAACARERPALKFLTSGPWPPYSFSNIHA